MHRAPPVWIALFVGAVIVHSASCVGSDRGDAEPWRFDRSRIDGGGHPDGRTDGGGCPPGAREICNGIDDDCDGRVDENLTRTCGTDTGVCRRVTVSCRNGGYPSCGSRGHGAHYTPDEGPDDCDGLDNDCDGVTDEKCGECEPGTTTSCYTADSSTRGVGRCEAGTRTCGSSRTWSACRGEVTPRSERCNGSDDDCDGVTDEACPCDYRGRSAGVCEGRTRTESGDCSRPPGFEESTDAESSCSGRDNDCDGVTDEGCPCNFLSRSEGVCTGQTRRTDGSCPVPPEFEAKERSRSDGLDNDCDGTVDETSRKGVDAGDSYSCALTGTDRAECWGWDIRPTNPPATDFTQISTGPYHSCGVTTAGAVECWGNSRFIPSGWTATNFVQVSSYYHTCGLRASGSVVCWGPSGSAKTQAPSGTFEQISAGGTFTCGIENDGSIECWGYDKNGQLDAPSGTFVQVSAGNTFACALAADGRVQCWGSQRDGRTNPPTGRFQDLDAGSAHICGVTTSRDLECWGRGGSGQTQPPKGSFVEVGSGLYHSCARTSAGGVACWGRNDHGESNPPRLSTAP